MFRTNYTQNKKTGIDCSNEYEKQFVEITPYTKDAKTGKYLNERSISIFKENGKVNIQEQIDSYRDTCDIYKIIDRYTASGDPALLNQRKGVFVDISDFPDDSNILTEIDTLLAKKQEEALKVEAAKVEADKAKEEKEKVEVSKNE